MVGTYSKQFLHFLVTFNLTLDPRPGLQETQCTTSYIIPNQFSHSLLGNLFFCYILMVGGANQCRLDKNPARNQTINLSDLSWDWIQVDRKSN